MKRRLAVIALLAGTAGLAACDRTAVTGDDMTPEASAAASDADRPPSGGNVEAGLADGSAARFADGGPEASIERPGEASRALNAGAGTAIEGAPAFAVIYPGARVEPTPLLTSGPGEVGGGIVFTSEASPDDIVGFYRRGAEAAGMTQVMAMNNAETRAYSAAKGPGGASLTIVAHPLEDGQTSAQLTWTVGP
jgi:hypothetical protein